jgi:hypothetical protein
MFYPIFNLYYNNNTIIITHVNKTNKVPISGKPVLRRCKPRPVSIQHLKSSGSMQPILPYWRNALIIHMTIMSCHVLTYGRVNHSTHDDIAREESRTRDPLVTVKGIRPCLQNLEQIQMCIVLMFKEPPGGHFKFPILVMKIIVLNL